MIVLETKSLSFGDGDIGTGSIIRKDGVGVVHFTDLSKVYEIGQKVKDINERQGIIVSLEFKKTESIDVVIKALERVKKLMLKESEN